jgi:hypothetical protein
VVPSLVLPQTIPVCSSPQPLCFQRFAASLSSPKKSTPLESTKSRLFFQNAGVGVPQKSRLWNQQHPDSLFRFCSQVSYGFPNYESFSVSRCLCGNSICSLFSASVSTPRSASTPNRVGASLRYPLPSFPRPRPVCRPFPSLDIQAFRSSDFCYSAVP